MDMSATAKGIKDLEKLSVEEREVVYNKLKEKGASDNAIETIKAMVTMAGWFRK